MGSRWWLSPDYKLPIDERAIKSTDPQIRYDYNKKLVLSIMDMYREIANTVNNKRELVDIDGTLDDIDDGHYSGDGNSNDFYCGSEYSKIISDAVRDGRVLLSEAAGTLDDIANGEYAKVLATAIEDGKVLLSEAVGNISDIDGLIEKSKLATELQTEIDKIAVHDTDIEGLVGSLSAAEGRIETAEGQISAAEGLLASIDGRVTINETDITQTKNDITLKASQLDLDATNGRVTEAEGLIAINAGAILLKASQSEVDTIEGRVTEAEGLIEVNAGAILLKASQADLDSLDDRVDSAETTISAHTNTLSSLSSEIVLKATIASLTNESEDWIMDRMAGAETDISALQTADGELVAQINDRVQISTYNADINAEGTGLKERTAIAEQTLWAGTSGLGTPEDPADDSILAKYTLKLNVDGRVAGFGLMLDDSNPSEFTILADRFFVTNENEEGDIVAPFVIDGQNIYIDGNLVMRGSIKLADCEGVVDDIPGGYYPGDYYSDELYSYGMYGKVSSTSIEAGKIVLAETIGSFDDIAEGKFYGKVLTTNISAGRILLAESIGSLDDIEDGDDWGKVASTDISSGHIRLTTCEGSLDDIEDGDDWGKIALTDIDAGHILLATCDGVLDDIDGGYYPGDYYTNDIFCYGLYGKVASTSIESGKIVLAETIGSLDDIAEGKFYGKVLTTNISAGRILLVECDGTLDDIEDGEDWGRIKSTGIEGGKITVQGLGSTIIEGGYIKTDLLDVDNIIATGSILVTGANTSDLNDDANLGGTAEWSGVTGANMPADNATVGADWNSNLANIPTFGDMAYEDLVESAKLGTTILSGGYIKTDLLDVDNIIATGSILVSGDPVTAISGFETLAPVTWTYNPAQISVVGRKATSLATSSGYYKFSSNEKYKNGAICSAVFKLTIAPKLEGVIGLGVQPSVVSNPSASQYYCWSIDAGSATPCLNGTYATSAQTAVSVGDKLGVSYDGSYFKFSINDVVIYTSTFTISDLSLYLICLLKTNQDSYMDQIEFNRYSASVKATILDSGYVAALRRSGSNTYRMQITPTAIEGYTNNVKTFDLQNGVSYWGDQANEHAKASSDGFEIYDGVTRKALFSDTVIIGQVASGKGNFYIDADGNTHWRVDEDDIVVISNAGVGSINLLAGGNINLVGHNTTPAKISFSGTSYNTDLYTDANGIFNYKTYADATHYAKLTQYANINVSQIVNMVETGSYAAGTELIADSSLEAFRPYANNSMTLGTLDRKWTTIYGSDLNLTGTQPGPYETSLVCDGTVKFPWVYQSSLSDGRDVFISSTGNLGSISSSARYKNLIQYVVDVSWLNKIDVWYYEHKEAKGILKAGFTAEQIADIRPMNVSNIVSFNEKGEPETVNYSQFVPYLTAGWQAHEAKIAYLENRIDELSSLLTFYRKG